MNRFCDTTCTDGVTTPEVWLHSLRISVAKSPRICVRYELPNPPLVLFTALAWIITSATPSRMRVFSKSGAISSMRSDWLASTSGMASCVLLATCTSLK